MQLKLPEQLRILNHTSVPEQSYILLKSLRCQCCAKGLLLIKWCLWARELWLKQGTPKGAEGFCDSNETLQLVRVDGAR